MVEDAEQLAGLGLTKDDLCSYWGISRQTLHRWERTRGDLSDAIKKGQVDATISVAKALRNHALKGNVTACIFWLKNRAGWSDEPPVAPTQPVYKIVHFNGAKLPEHHRSSRVLPLSDNDSPTT
jgi:DNA-binding XRE family transcriptional regulator